MCPTTIAAVPNGDPYNVLRTNDLRKKIFRKTAPTLKARRITKIFPEDDAPPDADSLLCPNLTDDQIRQLLFPEAEEPVQDPEDDDAAEAAARATAEEAQKIAILAAEQASESLTAWNTQDNLDRQQTQANDDMRAAELINVSPVLFAPVSNACWKAKLGTCCIHFIVNHLQIRLGWVAFDVRYGKHTWSDREFNREVIPTHVQTLMNSFTLGGCNRTRGDLPILAMTAKDYDLCLRYTANILQQNYEDVRNKASDPDHVRQMKVGDGVARTISDLVPLMLPPNMEKDPNLQPEVQAGHHRFVAMKEWSIKRLGFAQKLSSKGKLDDDATRDQVIEVSCLAIQHPLETDDTDV